MAVVPDPAWLPDADDLGALLAGHTIGQLGDATENSGNFGAVTGSIPTENSAAAEEAIRLASRKPKRLVGTITDEEITEIARDAVLCKAAAHYVSQVYSDQMHEGQRSRAEEYWSRQADEAIAELHAALSAFSAGDEPGPHDNVAPGRIAGWFPPSRMYDDRGRPRVI